jgi:hypothetical protein
MATIRITFQKIIQDSQEYGSDDEHMVSRAFFNIQIDGENRGDFSVDVKQIVGGDFETTPLEVGVPEGYKGPYEPFRQAVEVYYRSQVGSSGRGIHIAGGGNVRMYNNTFISTKIVEFDTEGSDAGW